MSFKVHIATHRFFTDLLKPKTTYHLIKFSPAASTTDRKHFLKCYGCFMKFSGFYLAKHFDQFGILLT